MWNIFKAFSNKINQVPSAHTFMLTANMFGTESPKEVVIVANETYPEIKSTILELQKSYNPHTVYLFKSMKEQSKLNQIAPWTETHIPIDDKVTFCQFDGKKVDALIDENTWDYQVCSFRVLLIFYRISYVHLSKCET